MKAQKILLTLLPVVIGGTLTACNSGGGSNGQQSGATQAPSQESSTQAQKKNTAFTFCNKYTDGTNNFCAESKTIRLNPLTDDQVTSATAHMDVAAAAVSMPESAFTLVKGVAGFPDNFYNLDTKQNLVPLDQQNFGTCVTFSVSAALSYLYSNYTSTVNVSPLDILDAGFNLEGQTGFTNLSGWDGLDTAGQLLERLKTVGYYNNYNDTNQTYISMSNYYGYNPNYSENLTYSTLTGLPGWTSQIDAYNSKAQNPYANNFAGLSYTALFQNYGNDNATLVKNALDSGKVVLLDFNIWDSQISSSQCNADAQFGTPNGTVAYQNVNGQLNLVAANGQGNNTWYYPTGCLLGGHQVWVVGYATASDGSLLFVVRNSWGNSGDQGQYYMSANYLNKSANYAAIATKGS